MLLDVWNRMRRPQSNPKSNEEHETGSSDDDFYGSDEDFDGSIDSDNEDYIALFVDSELENVGTSEEEAPEEKNP